MVDITDINFRAVVRPDPARMTNTQFLDEVYRFAPIDQKRWTLSMTHSSPSWSGYIGDYKGIVPEFPNRDNYYCVSTLTADADTRSSNFFAAAHVIVIDDTDPKNLPLAPSYVLETSPDNYQCGYLLYSPMTDQIAYDRFMKMLGRAGYGQDQSGNNVVRVVRLPVGTNTKPQYSRDGAEPPKCVLRSFDTRVRYTFDEIESAWLRSTREVLPTLIEAQGMSDADFEGLCDNIRKGVDYHDSINRVAARMVSRGSNPYDVKSVIRQLMEFTPPAQREERWVERYEDINRSVESAVDKYAPDGGTAFLEETVGVSLEEITLESLDAASLTPRVILSKYLYADVRTRISAGGTGKTTIALYEMVQLALGRPLWGNAPPGPVRSVLISREDPQGVLVARMREIMKAMDLSREEITQVLANIRIFDLSEVKFRLVEIKREVVGYDTVKIEWLADRIRAFKPDWILLDPMVSFGVGEQRVNDAEQGLIEAMRWLRGKFNACIEGIHHSGKANAREKSLDQYSGRGGSALSDGSRMVCVMQPLSAEEWLKATGQQLAEGESGIVMALPKLSYAAPQPSIYILRKGYHFEQVTALAPANAEVSDKEDEDLVLETLKDAAAKGVFYSRRILRDNNVAIFGGAISKTRILGALDRLKFRGLVTYPLDNTGSNGTKSVIEVVDLGSDPSEFSLKNDSEL
jgi:RecA-family ATPase